MVDNINERLKTNTTLSNISIEESDTNNNIGELTKLSNLLWSCQGDKWSKSGSWKHRLKSCGNLSFNGVRDGGIKLDWRIVTNDVLFILVEEVVKDLLIEKCDTLEVVTRSWFETDDLVDQSVGLVAQVSDVLLPLDFLFDICRIVTDLQFDCVQWGRINLLQALYCFLNKDLSKLIRHGSF